MYWVVRRDASMAGPDGSYNRMEIYSGPYTDKNLAWEEANSLNTQQQNLIWDETVSKDIRRAAHSARTNYWVLSDEQIQEARSKGVTIK
jgi:hypothetical protein